MLIISIIIVMIIATLFKTNELLKPQLMAIARQKTNNAISLLCQRVLAELDYDALSLINYEYDAEGNITSIQYDTKAMNKMLGESLKKVDDSLDAAIRGEEDPILKEVLYEDGVIYRVPIGYLTRIAFLQEYGYEFKIGMRIFQFVNGDIDVVTQPYGINSTLVNVNLGLSIEAEAITAMYSEKIHYEEVIPLIIQVVPGEVQGYVSTKKE